MKQHDVIISGLNMDLTDAIRNVVHAKVEKLFEHFLDINKLDKRLFEFNSEGKVIEIDEKKYYFCHGDDLDFDNPYYQRWKRVYSSKKFKFFIEKILPYRVLLKLGEKASGNSKKRGKKSFDYSKTQERYRKNALHVIEDKNCDVLIFGHTHIQENQTIDNKQFINNGFPVKDKSFVHYDGKTVSIKQF